MPTRVLIVEDDADINQIVATHLARCGFACTQAFSGSEAKLLLADATNSFDVVLSDLMLPGLSGEELVSLVRARDARVPIIVISARTAASDRVSLLGLGADDYLTKPFDLDELVARIRVQLRHRGLSAQGGSATGHGAADGCGASGDGMANPGATGNAAKDCPASLDATDGENPALLHFGAWELDPAARTFTVDGIPVELTRIEFNIVEVLVEHPRRVFSKAELFERAWGEPYTVDDNTVNVHVSNIRAKLKATGTDGYIKTVWGMGFKLERG